MVIYVGSFEQTSWAGVKKTMTVMMSGPGKKKLPSPWESRPEFKS